jgi:hypothetical protein
LSGEQFAAVNVQRLTGRERVRQGEPHALCDVLGCADPPFRIADGKAPVSLLWRRRLTLRQVVAWFHVAFREFLTGILTDEFIISRFTVVMATVNFDDAARMTPRETTDTAGNDNSGSHM